MFLTGILLILGAALIEYALIDYALCIAEEAMEEECKLNSRLSKRLDKRKG